MSNIKRFGVIIVGMLILSIIPSFVGQAAAFTIPNGDTAALINAINQANASAGKDEINLAPGGTYSFNQADNEVLDVVLYDPVLLGANALPQINSNITINGNGATLQRDLLFSSCNASNELRMFWVNGSGKLTLNNVNIKNGCVGEYGEGGAAFVWDGGVINIIGGTYENNSTTGIVLAGGAIGVDGSTLFVEGAQFINNKSTYQGGAVYLESSTGVFLNANFTGNSNPSQGGAVAGIKDSDVTIYFGTFSTNSANGGGALSTSDAGKMRVVGSSFISNSSFYEGGAISNDGSTLTVSGVASFFANTSGQAGGAIALRGINKTYVYDSVFTSNTATRYGGGAVSVNAGDAYIFNSTFTDNKSLDEGGWGGGFLVNAFGKVTLVNVNAMGNTSNGYGGAINTSGDLLNITGSTIADNSGTYGGGVYSTDTEISIHSSTFSGNDATNGFGGAVYHQDNLKVFNSTFSGNTATGEDDWGVLGGGGAIFSSTYYTEPASSLIVNSTFSGNSTQKDGGAIFVDGVNAVTLENVTMTGNTANGNGGGVFNGLDDGSAAPVLTRSILVGNNGGDCGGTATSSGNNVLGNGCDTTGNDQSASAGSVLNTTLSDNGGLTKTHALVAGSPAVDLGGTGCTAADQRGFARSGACDAGAFELNGTNANIPGIVMSQSGGSTNVAENGAGDSYTVTLANAPTGLVTLNIVTDGEVSASPSTLIFTSANWNVPQTVNVTANVDFLTEAAHGGKIVHVVTGSDISYNAVPAGVLLVTISADSTGGEQPTEEPTTPTGPTATPTATLTPEPQGELTEDGGFEVNGVWAVKNASKDKRKCNKDGKVFSFTGGCAFLFKGGTNENSQISQKLTNLTMQTGDTLQLSAWVSGKNTVNGGSIKVKITYADSTTGKMTLNVNPGSYGYTQLVHPTFTLPKGATSVKLAVKNRSASGQFLIDDLSFVHTSSVGITNDEMGLMALPTAEANGRGQ
jgi:predicted outer membrane repeat protein